jgi:Bacterial inner membrane protein
VRQIAARPRCFFQDRSARGLLEFKVDSINLFFVPAALLIHFTGVCALALNVLALLRTSETTLRIQSGVAGVAWSINNLLLGSPTAAALSLVSAGRTASSAATLRSAPSLRYAAFSCFTVVTLGVSVATWHGLPSVMLLAASIVSTYAMFYLRERKLRCSMLVVSALWMYNAWVYGSWEQMAANVATAAAALYGAYRIPTASRSPRSGGIASAH